MKTTASGAVAQTSDPTPGVCPDARGSLRFLLEPQSVAVIGAGRQRGGVGAELFHNLAAGGFTGAAIPINPCADEVQSVRAYGSVRDVPGRVDLAVIAVRTEAVERALEECIAKGVRAVVVISAGFAETGREGQAREARLRAMARAAGVRMVGPNCMGLVNTAPAFHLNATFSPVFPPAGPIAFDQLAIALSIGVQRMVRSDLASAGVMFTLDTESGFRDVVLINASYGLGETVVQGSVTPDEYYVFKPTLAQGFRPILEKTIGSKEFKLVYDEGGSRAVENVPVSVADRARCALSDDDILSLARWGCAIEAHYSSVRGLPTPMDIEWAKDGRTGELFIV